MNTTKNSSRYQRQPSTLLIVFIITLINSVGVSVQNSNDNAAIVVPVRSVRSHQVAQSNWHEPRIELRYNSKNRFVNLEERLPNNTVVAIVFVSDEDTGPGGETTVAIEAGNELGHFKLVVTPMSNTIQVNGAPLSRQSIPEYNLTLVARDRGTPPRMSAVNLTIKLTSLPSTQSPLEPPPIFKPPPVSDLIHAGALLVILFSASVFFIIIGCALVRKPRGKKPALPEVVCRTSSSGKATNWNANLDLYSL